MWAAQLCRVGARFEVRVRVRVRGDYFLLLHTAFYSRVGQIAIFKSLSTIRLGVLIEICQSSQSSDFVTVHRHTDLSGFG